jgi:hypothetical protein
LSPNDASYCHQVCVVYINADTSHVLKCMCGPRTVIPDASIIVRPLAFIVRDKCYSDRNHCAR